MCNYINYVCLFIFGSIWRYILLPSRKKIVSDWNRSLVSDHSYFYICCIALRRNNPCLLRPQCNMGALHATGQWQYGSFCKNLGLSLILSSDMLCVNLSGLSWCFLSFRGDASEQRQGVIKLNAIGLHKEWLLPVPSNPRPTERHNWGSLLLDIFRFFSTILQFISSGKIDMCVTEYVNVPSFSPHNSVISCSSMYVIRFGRCGLGHVS